MKSHRNRTDIWPGSFKLSGGFVRDVGKRAYMFPEIVNGTLPQTGRKRTTHDWLLQGRFTTTLQAATTAATTMGHNTRCQPTLLQLHRVFSDRLCVPAKLQV